jgi:flagellar biosynthesis/type III secretory pathway chaperone
MKTVSVLKPLFAVVDAMLNVHQELLAIAQRKRDVLIRGDMEALNLIVKEENTLVFRVEKLEGERIAFGRLLAERIGVAPEQLTAARVAELAGDAEEKHRMTSLTDELRQVIGQLQALNDTNKKLIEQSLQFIRTSIEVLSESPQVPTYGDKGASNAPYASGKTSYFDSKA